MTPGETGVKMVPIIAGGGSFFTNVKSGERIKAGAPTVIRGIAFGGDTGVSKVDVSQDGGATWQAAPLDKDQGKYSFQRWQTSITPRPGEQTLMVRCTNSNGLAQPMKPTWTLQASCAMSSKP